MGREFQAGKDDSLRISFIWIGKIFSFRSFLSLED